MKLNIKNIIIFMIFMAVFVAGITFLILRRPSVYIGNVEIVTDNERVSLDGFRSESVFKKKIDEFDIPSIAQISKTNLQIFHQSKNSIANDILNDQTRSPITDTTDTSFYVQTNSGLKVTGLHIDEEVVYNIYNVAGELEHTDNKLYIPVDKLVKDNADNEDFINSDEEECIVEIIIKWGRKNNYEEYHYYFKCIIS